MDQRANADIANAPSPRTPARFWVIAVALILILFAGYWFFLRTTFEPVLANVAPQDAADIVKVLEAKKIPYQLADGGSTIRVASDQADKARIELIGSELPMRGQVGFELFNQSDMGLTEFAQKINYQRALQGELARTILLIEGIQSVRVHLALPDHSLFRDEQSRPKASVTLILKPGKTVTEGTVAGIQRLVAGAIPDMGAGAVAVLDGSGRVVSQEGVAPPEPIANSDAIIQNYRRLITAAISASHPELRFDANVSLRFLAVPVPAGALRDGSAPGVAPAPPGATSAPPGVTPAPPGVTPAPPGVTPAPLPGWAVAGNGLSAPRGDPDYALAVRVTTRDPMDDSLRSDIARIVQASMGFAAARGDSVVFLTGPLVTDQSVAPAKMNADRVVAQATPDRIREPGSDWLSYWPIAIPVAVIVLGLAFWNDRRRARDRNTEHLAAFTDQLRKHLVAQADPI